MVQAATDASTHREGVSPIPTSLDTGQHVAGDEPEFISVFFNRTGGDAWVAAYVFNFAHHDLAHLVHKPHAQTHSKQNHRPASAIQGFSAS